MQLLKFSILSLILFINLAQSFTSMDCLKANYETEITHKGELFGLIKHEFKIIKQRCLIEITQKKIFPKQWNIDVCREPIHTKIDSKGSVNVYKRVQDCSLEKEESDYCDELKELLNIMQDDGLIFAEGERDKIDSPHGQVYCSYLLVKNYLEQGLVFSPEKDSIDIFESKKETCTTDSLPENKNQGLNTAPSESKEKEAKPTGSF